MMGPLLVAGALTVTSGGWLIGVLLGYFQWQDWGHVYGLLVLFGIGVASLFAESWLGVRERLGPAELKKNEVNEGGDDHDV